MLPHGYWFVWQTAPWDLIIDDVLRAAIGLEAKPVAEGRVAAGRSSSCHHEALFWRRGGRATRTRMVEPRHVSFELLQLIRYS
jgi:hypothetical protein